MDFHSLSLSHTHRSVDISPKMARLLLASMYDNSSRPVRVTEARGRKRKQNGALGRHGLRTEQSEV